jgi:hypothetical protein
MADARTGPQMTRSEKTPLLGSDSGNNRNSLVEEIWRNGANGGVFLYTG